MRILLSIILILFALDGFSQIKWSIPIENEDDIETILLTPEEYREFRELVTGEAQPIEIDKIKEQALSTNALSTIKGKYTELELLDCAKSIGLMGDNVTTKGTNKTQLAKLLIKHFQD